MPTFLAAVNAKAKPEKERSQWVLFTMDKTVFLKMDAYEFDQTPTGWRSLPDREAAKLLEEYIEHYPFGIPQRESEPLDVGLLWFHAAQNWAFAEETENAIRCLQESLQSYNPKTNDSWLCYVQATLAFLAKDRDTFDRVRLGAANEEVLNRLSEDWGGTYSKVY